MQIIKLNATESTNSYLRDLYSKQKVVDYTVVLAKKQKKGRGQMGTVWSSQEGKNLTFSVFKGLKGLDIENTFFVSIVTSLAIVKALKALNISNLKIKWPNDILSDNYKICGILIENVIKNNELDSCIIGIGLNVNQMEFKDLPKASSLKLLTGIHYTLDEVLNEIVNKMEQYFIKLRKGNLSDLMKEYESHLFRKNKPSTFTSTEGTMFSGYIKGITNSGKLSVLLEDNIISEYDLKEITLLY